MRVAYPRTIPWRTMRDRRVRMAAYSVWLLAVGAGGEARLMDLYACLGAFLRHPLVLLLAGAVLSGFGVQWITHQWQLRQKSLELKIGLVTELSELVMRFLTVIQLVPGGAESFSQEAFQEAYRDWKVGSAVFGTKLQAYLGDVNLPREWTEFSDEVTKFSDDVTHLADKKGEAVSSRHDALLDWKLTLNSRTDAIRDPA
jgi:hypothetical protein